MNIRLFKPSVGEEELEALKEVAIDYAFILDLEGIKN